MGLAMGIAGTEVAKAAADIVIMVSVASLHPPVWLPTDWQATSIGFQKTGRLQVCILHVYKDSSPVQTYS